MSKGELNRLNRSEQRENGGQSGVAVQCGCSHLTD